MEMNDSYIPTTAGLKALYEHNGKAMELIFESILSGGEKVEENKEQTNDENRN